MKHAAGIFHEYHVPYREANALNNLGLLYHTREQAEQALATIGRR